MMPNSSFSVQQLHQQHAHAHNSSASPSVAVAGGQTQTMLQQEHPLPRSMGCWKTVQQLNNLGCVNVTMGNYPEANRLFELALKKHMAISEYVTSDSCRGCASCYYTIDTMASCKCHSTDDSLSLASSEDTIECGDDFSMEDDESMISNDTDDSSTHSLPRTSQDEVLTPSGGAIGLDSDPIDSNQYHRIPRMTTCSQLPCSSSSSNNNTYNKTVHTTNCHQVYCLPIVMDNLEWRSSSLDEKTFVLVFNTAICNQLWGMYFQQQEQHESLKHPHQSKEAFLVAEKLYRLALNNVCGVGSLRQTRHTHSSARHHCQLYFLAGLNNLSHAVKTLYGSHSSEALKIDRMLLTAIFWWRDSRNQGRGISNASSSSDDYDNADDEIVHLFLQHVFHLVGASESLIPAAAA